WLNLGAPSPLPPSSPFQLSNNNLLEGEDGFTNITAEDHHEYDRWYVEESQEELDKMIADTLTKEDRDSIKMTAIKQFGHISQRNKSASVTIFGKAYGKRDNMFVRCHYYKGRNINQPCREPGMYLATGYRRLDFVLALTLPADPRFGIEGPQLHIVAYITKAEDAEGDARTECVFHTQLGQSFVLDITTIQRVVGRVETRGEKATGEWVKIDRNDELCSATFHPEEVEHKD
ncbi:hypothetical protein FRC09_012912, partial [Ceratobasidium sp. 395]